MLLRNTVFFRNLYARGKNIKYSEDKFIYIKIFGCLQSLEIKAHFTFSEC